MGEPTIEEHRVTLKWRELIQETQRLLSDVDSTQQREQDYGQAGSHKWCLIDVTHQKEAKQSTHVAGVELDGLCEVLACTLHVVLASLGVLHLQVRHPLLPIYGLQHNIPYVHFRNVT